MNNSKSYVYAIIAIMFWGSASAVSSLLVKSMSNMQVLFISSLFAAVFLFIFNLFTKRIAIIKSLSLKDWFRLAALGLLGMFVYCAFFYQSVELLSAQQASTINYLWPIIIVILSCITNKKRPGFKTLFSLSLSFFGLIIVATKGRFSDLSGLNTMGIFCALGGAISYALFSVLNMKVKIDKYIATMVYYIATTLFSFLFSLDFGFSPVDSSQVLGLAWMGIVTFGLAYSLWAIALDNGSTAKISNLAYLTPVISLVYIYFLLGESIHWSTYIGLTFVLLGVAFQIVDFKSICHKV